MTRSDDDSGHDVSIVEERYYAVMRYFAHVLWAMDAADESLTVLSAVLAEASTRSQDHRPGDRAA